MYKLCYAVQAETFGRDSSVLVTTVRLGAKGPPRISQAHASQISTPTLKARIKAFCLKTRSESVTLVFPVWRSMALPFVLIVLIVHGFPLLLIRADLQGDQLGIPGRVRSAELQWRVGRRGTECNDKKERPLPLNCDDCSDLSLSPHTLSGCRTEIS